ncbi:MAG TPA: hypothetical protein VJ783_30785 [Pirellulales bacterium]|nr:hypothetical protein [Pirellulales bacterium]
MADSGREVYTSANGGGTVRALRCVLPRQIVPRPGTLGVQTALLFSLLLLLQLGFGVLTPIGISLGSWWDHVHMAIMGATLAPPTLLALWAVFGPQRLAVRLPLTLWLTTVCYLAIAYGEKRNNGQATIGLELGTAWLLAFVITQIPLWLLRAVRRWRLIAPVAASGATALNAEQRHGAKSLQSSQFTLRALLGWVLATATSLAALRCLSPATDFNVEELPLLLSGVAFIGPMVALAGLPVVPLAWIMLVDGPRLVLRTVLILLTLAGLAIGLLIFQSLEDAETAGSLAVLEAGALLDGLVSLGVVRACGCRLRRRAKRTDGTAPIPLQTVSRPLSRWRFALAAAPILAIAAVMACGLPERFELWRRADVAAQWRERGVHIVYDDDGHVTSAQCKGKSLSDDELRSIVALGNLESLDLRGISIGNRQLALLAPLTNLRSLTLSHTPATDSDLELLAQFNPQLDFLDLTGTAVTDAGMEHLKQLRRLRALHLNLTDLSDTGLATLADVLQLQVVEAEMTAVTKAGATNFLKKRPRAQLSYGASDFLLARSLYVDQIVEFSGGVVRNLGYARIPLKLKRLHARGKTVVNGAKCMVTDAGLAALAGQAELEELDLRESGVTDQGLSFLQKLKSLKQLDVRGTAVTEQGAARLVQSLPDCRVLR